MATTSQTPIPALPKAKTPHRASSLTRKLVPVDAGLLLRAAGEAFIKLNPATLYKNPVILIVEVSALIITLFFLHDVAGVTIRWQYELQLAAWLWLIVLLANFAEAVAQARGKAQADTLRKTKTDSIAKRVLPGGKIETVPAWKLRASDIVTADAGDFIPGDGEVIDGIATVDESVITGESAPVIRESSGDRRAVTGGTRILSDSLKIRITTNAGETFLDKMIALVEGTERIKTKNEMAISRVITGLTLASLLVAAALTPLALKFSPMADLALHPGVSTLVAFSVCLIPTTIAGLLSAIGIAGMNRLMTRNVLTNSAQALEAAADIDTYLIDKTGTITLGNREAIEFIAFAGVNEERLADAAQLASLGDGTPEGRSIAALAQQKYGLRASETDTADCHFIPFSAYTRISGVDLKGRMLRKGATAAIAHLVRDLGGAVPDAFQETSDRISRTGGTPLAVAEGDRALGIIHLKDLVKDGIKDRIAQLDGMGIHTAMVTGDNPLTAAAIAHEAGIADFRAQATPAGKLTHIKSEQHKGRLVAMTGDGTNDAPALAQADVGLTMNTGATAAKEAGNMVDLDSDPTKLVEVVAIGRQLLVTRTALAAFSIVGDLAIFLAILPVLLAGIYPTAAGLNILHLQGVTSVVLASVIYKAVTLASLTPLAFRGLRYSPSVTPWHARSSIFISGFFSFALALPAIWLLDRALSFLHLA